MRSSTGQRRPEATTPPADSGDGPLAGLRVVDLTDGHPGAVATMLLADYGAEVLKLVPPGGDFAEESPPYRVWNRNKRSASLDLKADPQAIGTARELIDSADVVVESMGVGVADGLGIGWGQVSAANSRLIYCSITPWGLGGPMGGRDGPAAVSGDEGIVAAASGVLTEQRGDDGRPIWNSLPLVGYGAALLASMGVLAALHRREVTGRGQLLETSLYQGSLAARSAMLVRGEGVQVWDSAGSDPQGALPNYRLYRCSDGKWLHIGALVPAFWNKLAIAIDLLDLVTDPRFETAPLYWPDEETRAAAKQLLALRLAEESREHWLEVLHAGDVPATPAMESHELFDHYQVLANGRQSTVRDPDLGRIDMVSPPVRMWRTPGAVRKPAPRPGEHRAEWATSERTAPAGESFASAADPAFRGPLSGVRVLDLSSYLAGPIGPAHLADLGADVVKIEPPAGEGCRMIMMLYLGGNTGKRGLALDIKSGAGKGVLIRLIEWSDVLVHNNRVGVAERLGIDYETVRRLRPDVIYLQSTAYGSEGPDAPLPGFDPLFQSLTGISAAQGGPGHPPVFPKTPICDISTAMLGAIAILLALRHRDLTGEGQLIETSLLATGLWLKSDAFVRHHGWSPPRLTNSDNTGLHAAYRSYRAQDGYLFIATRTEEQRRALGAATGVQDAIRAGEHGVDDDAITARISGAVVDRTVEEWLRTFERTGVPAAAVAEDNEEGVFGHPQVAHLGAVVSAEYPGYTSLQQPGVLIGFSESPGERRAGSPACGEHTVDVLEELGYSSDEIAELERAGAVAVYRDEED